MRYAVFTDVHANLEALEAVLAEIDTLSKEDPIDQIWFLGDLVGYGPNPNECITMLRKRTDVIIAGNHDWAAVGKIDLEDFSTAARISAEWTAQQLTEEHHTFLEQLPERLEIDDCTLVHGSPYGPLWEYLTSEALAERSFQHFSSRLCFVGHTHVPIIFQQPDSIANAPTLPLEGTERNGQIHTPNDTGATTQDTGIQENESSVDTTNTTDMAMISSTIHTAQAANQAESAYADPATGEPLTEDDANAVLERHSVDTVSEMEPPIIEVIVTGNDTETSHDEAPQSEMANDATAEDTEGTKDTRDIEEEISLQEDNAETVSDASAMGDENSRNNTINANNSDEMFENGIQDESAMAPSSEDEEQDNVESLNSEIEELLELLSQTESMIQVTNEMLKPPEGHWDLPEGYRAIINPGGVGQPRDNDARAAFMIYDTERGFEFYRISYNFHKTQEKILKVGLPPYLAIRLAHGL
jgi:diadenosine tetraphosphatase ApaH/serine/threonine PP2A family protein phosphatase